MLLSLAVGIGAAIAAIARGGSLDNLSDTRFRLAPVLVLTLALQAAVQLLSPASLKGAAAIAFLLTTNAIVAVVVLLNARLPGLTLALIGLIANSLAIALNGAMPVSEDALRIARVDPHGYGLKHEALTQDTLVPWLTDVIPVPVFRQVMSVGDALIAVGLGRLIYIRTRGIDAYPHEP